jgi:hypothetical protein
MVRGWLAAVAAMVVLGAGPVEVRASGVDAWAAMGMLEGAWREVRGTAVIDEVWTNNKGNVIVGMSRTVDGLSNGFEFMRIENRKAGIVFIAQPGGDPATVFRLASHDGKTLVFENAAHGWPQRVEYRRTAADTLEATVGPITGKGKTLLFTYKRVR